MCRRRPMNLVGTSHGVVRSPKAVLQVLWAKRLDVMLDKEAEPDALSGQTNRVYEKAPSDMKKRSKIRSASDRSSS